MFAGKHSAAARRRAALLQEWDTALRELRANEAAYERSDDDFYTEQLIYQHAALLCRCRAVLRQLRREEGDMPCLPR